MANAVNLLIHGANGRMGKALLRLAGQSEDCFVVIGTGRSNLPALDAVPAFDVAIDFSAPEGFDAALALCLKRGVALVSGTTGLSALQFDALAQAAKTIPIIWASNFSLGVAVLDRLVAEAGHLLPDWQLDILESHHIHKKDAPSGTALSLGATAKASSGQQPVYHSLRVGDVVGEHTVQFTGIGERIELVHRATDRDIFARGALHAAKRLCQKPAGLYRISEIL